MTFEGMHAAIHGLRTPCGGRFKCLRWGENTAMIVFELATNDQETLEGEERVAFRQLSPDEAREICRKVYLLAHGRAFDWKNQEFGGVESDRWESGDDFTRPSTIEAI